MKPSLYLSARALTLLLIPFVAAACSDDDDGSSADTRDTADTSDSAETTPDPDTTDMDSAGDGEDVADTEDGPDTVDVADTDQPDTDPSDTDTGDPATTFVVTLTNVSDRSALPTPFAPGVFVLTNGSDPLFTEGERDRGDGLEALAEDGNPMMLADALGGSDATASGAFATPEGADGPGPIFPGDSYRFEVEAMPGDGALHFATMLVQSNDLFVGPDGAGIPLFDGDGMPLAERDVTSMLQLWDAGTEVDEAPGLGPWQAPRQGALPSPGPAEGVVHGFGHTTRALPLAPQIADVSVSASDGVFTITVRNVSRERGAFMTPLAPVFWAVHNGEWSLFEPGAPASPGLETQAEDGSPAGLVAEHAEADGVGAAGAQPVADGADEGGPIGPGGSYTFEVTPSRDYPLLTLSFMIVNSNDAFISPPPGGVPLVDMMGMPRAAAAVEADLMRRLAVWDAGTESNEVPGFGPNQPVHQPEPNTGASDPMEEGVARYHDSRNDLAPGNGLIQVSVVAGAEAGTVDVTVMAAGAESPFPLILAPVMWVAHPGDVALFEMGMPASEELEIMAEDGGPDPLVEALAADGADAGALEAVEPEDAPSYWGGTITVSAEAPYLNLAGMVVPSNDTFWALGPMGVAIYDDEGAMRSDEDIAADIAAALLVADAGTEGNQAFAMGPDMAPHQAEPNTGPSEGDGTVRAYEPHVWWYPPVGDVLQVTISPAE